MRYSWLPLGLLVAAFIAFIGTAVGASLSLSELIARDGERSQALATRTELRRLLTLLLDVETGQRGFLITGQQAFLRPYEEALEQLRTTRAALRERISRHNANRMTLARLDALIDERLRQARTTVDRRLQQGGAFTPDLAAYVDGKRVMDELRFQIDQLEQEQQAAVTAADAATQDVQRRTTRLTRLLPAGGALMGAVALGLMLRERRLRDRAEAALRDANANLEAQVAQRTDALSRALSRIRSFAVEMDRGIEAERRRLAREVHDQIGQVGTAIKMLTLSLRAKLAPQTEPLVDELQAMADEAIRSAREISAALRPPLLDELGLEAALDHYLQTLQRQSGVVTRMTLAEPGLLPAEQASTLFRIIQEACTNVLRHAQARNLRVAAWPLTQAAGAGYEVEVIDDGRGPGDVRPDAAGLRNMRERAALAGGTFDFGPAPDGGTRVRVWLPTTAPQPLIARPEPEEPTP
ncbi:CHASE3 domain-containing protein [Roseateles puraquae]|uniref:CHASE3 domain-containing protein n=1 Tax=Roseateles puraquae TaxID=431059 RepID=UPI0031D78399